MTGKPEVGASSSANANSVISYRPDIDGLRAISVLSVLAYHISPSHLSGGFAGVDVFFVISGYLISLICFKESRLGHFRLQTFYVRRISRLYPALVLILLFVIIVGWIIALPSDYTAMGQSIVGGSAFIANIVFMGQVGYLDGAVEFKPLLHLWSLGVEEQYYLVFPAFCLLCFKPHALRGFTAAVAAVLAASLILCVILTASNRDMAFYLPFTRIWEILSGTMLALADYRTSSEAPRWRATSANLLSAVGLGLILASLLFIKPTDPFPGFVAAAPCLGALAILAAGPNAALNRLVLSWRPIVWIGLISYPLYLWHWPILSFTRIYFGQENISGAAKLLVIATSFAAAIFTYYAVEQPLRRMGSGRAEKRRKAAALFVAVVLAGLVGGMITLSGGFPQRWPASVVALDHHFDLAKAWREGSCFLKASQNPSQFSPTCAGDYGGAKNGRILLWGDSHAADLYPGLVNAEQSGISIAQYTAGGCPPVLGVTKADRPLCRRVNDAVFAEIRRLKPDAIIMSGDWDALEKLQRDGRHDKLSPEHVGQIATTIEQIRALGVKHVFVVGSIPYWPRYVSSLLIQQKMKRLSPTIEGELPRDILINSNDQELQRAVTAGGGAYISLMNALCDSTRCRVSVGPTWRQLLYSDAAHLTELGSQFVVQRTKLIDLVAPIRQAWWRNMGGPPFLVFPRRTLEPSHSDQRYDT